MLRQCCCDPHKMTYISAIITAVEAVLFGVLNVVLICMNACVIQPPSNLQQYHLDLDKFWAWYFYDGDKCTSRYENYTPPKWIDIPFPLNPRKPETTVDANFRYQVAYLALHSCWFLSAFILLYGNARKLWGYYVPWLLITIALVVMDLTIGVFYIMDMADAGNKYTSALFWVFAMYMRIIVFWFMNLSEFGTAFNAFCKSRHKRKKQARKERAQKKKQAVEVAQAAEAADAAARAELTEQYQQRIQQEQRQNSEPPWVNNDAYEDSPELPKKPRPEAPSELRPFNYLNPCYRPPDQHDLEGMRANAAPAIEIPVREETLTMDLFKEDYFPTDEYMQPLDTLPPMKPVAFPRRHGSLRNYHTQEPHLGFRRFSSTRGPPRPTNYNNNPRLYPPPDYDKLHDAKALLSSISKLQPLPRINTASKAPLHHQLSHQGRPLPNQRGLSYSPPLNQSRPRSPPQSQSRPHSPPPNQRAYFPDSYPKISYI
ncbi:uncharacterized protein [Panulirus ornatus]|uniref:uncharacterized protein n=1 Tax=Panulirus ornatus TaxID=150431 RepID=UPI003A874FFD